MFDWSNFFRHVKLLQTLLTSRLVAADGTLIRASENSRHFHHEYEIFPLRFLPIKAPSFRAERGMERMG
ncbi:MAG: hypothetical protein DMF35_05630 [Verrucomicrobia bacterium]|nr:MAG: hypothetical protein DMF35_05630 [Verrucomicrobiota bacterium]